MSTPTASGGPPPAITEPTLTSKYAHTEGKTLISYLRDGAHFLTAGDDTLLQKYKSDDPDLLGEKVHYHEGAITGLAVSARHYATGSDDYKVALHTAADFQCTRTLVECQLPVVDLAFDPSGEWLAVASEETVLRVIQVSNPREMKTIANLPRCPKSICFDPRQKWLTIALSDGSFRAYEVDFTADNFKLVSAITAVMSPQEPSSTITMTMSWHPKGDYVAVPAFNDIKLLARDTFRVLQTLKGHNKLVMFAIVSPNGRLLASADEDQVLIWSLANHTIQSRYRTEHAVSSLAWHPTKNELMFVDRAGEMALWQNVVSEDLFRTAIRSTASADDAEATEKSHRRKASPSPSPQRTSPSHEQRSEKKRKKSHSLIDDEAMRDGDEDVLEAEGDVAADDFDDLDDFVEDDDGAGYVAEKRAKPSSAGRPSLTVAETLTVEDVQELFPMQEIVQPGATPLLKDNKRFLAFTMLGTIKATDHPTGRSIDIEFHDMSVRRPIYFKDHYQFEVASLGEKGAIFGSRRQSRKKGETEEADNGLADELGAGVPSSSSSKKAAVLHYYSFDDWAGQANWTVDLPLHEDIEVVTSGSDWIAVGLESGQLHIFSQGGVQRDLIGIQGAIIGLAASEETLFVCYHQGVTLQEQQQIAYMLLNVESMEVMQQGFLAITNRSDLTWLGFSESGLPCVYDSSGVLWQLFTNRKKSSSLWRPIFDERNERKSKKEHFWPIAVSDTQMTCVICKNEIYPTVTNPILSDINLKMPVVQPTSATRQLEERWLRVKLMTDHVESTTAQEEEAANDALANVIETQRKQLDRLTLKMIKDACTAQQTVKALDLSKNLYDDLSYEYAYRLAVTFQQPQLAHRMMQMREAKAAMTSTTMHEGETMEV